MLSCKITLKQQQIPIWHGLREIQALKVWLKICGYLIACFFEYLFHLKGSSEIYWGDNQSEYKEKMGLSVSQRKYKINCILTPKNLKYLKIWFKIRGQNPLVTQKDFNVNTNDKICILEIKKNGGIFKNRIYLSRQIFDWDVNAISRPRRFEALQSFSQFLAF